ncbi:polyprotein [Bienertia sinuspersici]
MSSSASTSRKKARKAKNAAGNRTDPGWEHGFEVEGDPTKIKCKYCGVVRGSGIYRHKHHLAGTRSNVEPYLQVPDEVKFNFRQLLEANAQKSNEKRKKFNDIGEEEENYDTWINALDRVSRRIARGVQNSGEATDIEAQFQMLSDDDEVEVTFDSNEIDLDHILDDGDEIGAAVTGGTSTGSDDVEDGSFGYDD